MRRHHRRPRASTGRARTWPQGRRQQSNGKTTEATIQAADYRNMVDFDLEAVKRFIQQQHQAKKLQHAEAGDRCRWFLRRGCRRVCRR